MEKHFQEVLLTGGAGFVGSHLVDGLINRGFKVSIELIVFFSSSTVYGEPKEIPTSEEYAPLLPISVYGASKLGDRSMTMKLCRSLMWAPWIRLMSNAMLE